jgi:cytochrome c biogenesis protein CcdA
VRHLVLAWYAWLSTLSQGFVFTVEVLNERVNLPLASALLFGLIGAASPCQLTTNLGALAYASRGSSKAGALGSALAYAAGKVAVYSLVEALLILAGLQLQAASIPVVVVARKLLGPLMVLVGLGMLGAIRLKGTIGERLSFRLRRRVPPRGTTGAFLLGVAFSLAFCPTLFWLFFGLTVPLALRSAGGWAFPGLFAVGSTLPLLAASLVVALGYGAAERLAGGTWRIYRITGVVAGGIFVLAGLHDTVVYWWL